MKWLLAQLTRLVKWLADPKYRPFKIIGLLIFSLLSLYTVYRGVDYLLAIREPRNRAFLEWWRGDAERRAELVTVQREACTNAPSILPADGFIGLLYADPRGPYSASRPHQGIDIFSAAGVGMAVTGTTPVGKNGSPSSALSRVLLPRLNWPKTAR